MPAKILNKLVKNMNRNQFFAYSLILFLTLFYNLLSRPTPAAFALCIKFTTCCCTFCPKPILCNMEVELYIYNNEWPTG